MKGVLRYAKLIMLSIFAAGFLSGCSNYSSMVGSQDGAGQLSFPLISVSHHGNDLSKVYKAAGQTVPEVAKELERKHRPEQVSKVDPKQMFLVYSDSLYNIQQDTKNKKDTIIEVDNKSFVQNNYHPSFLDYYLASTLLNHLFFPPSYYHSHPRTVDPAKSYRGYATMDKYKPAYSYKTATSFQKKKYAMPPVTVHKTGTITQRIEKSINSWAKSSSTKTYSNKSPPKTTNKTGTITKRKSSSNSFWGSSSNNRSSWGNSSRTRSRSFHFSSRRK